MRIMRVPSEHPANVNTARGAKAPANASKYGLWRREALPSGGSYPPQCRLQIADFVARIMRKCGRIQGNGGDGNDR